MPMFNDEDFSPMGIAQYEPPETAEPETGDIIGAAFRQENSLYSFAANGGSFASMPPVKDGYDPFADANELSGYEQYADAFASSMSPEHTLQIKNQIDRELKDKQVLNDGGITSFAAQVVAGTLDPIFLPFMLTPAGWGVRGSSAVKTGLKLSLSGGVAETAAEYAKHQSQMARTTEESILNISGATLLSGIAGTTLKGIDNRIFENTTAKIESQLAAPDGAEELSFNDGGEFGSSSVGAAQVKAIESEYLELEGTGTKIEKLPVSPILRTMKSDSVSTRSTVQRMIETPVITKGEKAGIAVAPEGGSVETRIKATNQTLLGSGYQAAKSHYLQYRQKGTIGATFETLTGRRGDKLSKLQFNEEIGKAMRRNDEHPIPEVAAAAKQIRKEVFDPLKEKAIDAGLLDADVEVKTADSYLTRMYNHEKIIQNRHQWDEILKNWLKRDAVKAEAEQGKILELKQSEGRGLSEISDEYFATSSENKSKRKSLREEMQIAARREGKTDYEPYFAAKAEIEEMEIKISEARAKEKNLNVQIGKAKDAEQLKKMSEQLQDWKRDRIDLQSQLKKKKSVFNQIKRAREQDQSIGTRISGGKDDVLQSVVDSITDKILGAPGGRFDYNITPTVKGPLKERTLSINDNLIEDFLVSDIEPIMNQYIKTMAPDIELTNMFGDINLSQEIAAIKNEYAKLRQKAKSKTELKRLDQRMNSDIRDVEAMRDRLRGTYLLPKNTNAAIFRMGVGLMGWNFVRMLGSMMVSSLPDIGRVIAKNGFVRTARSIAALTNFKKFKLSKDEVRKAGIGFEMVLNGRAASLNDLTDIYASGTKVEKGLKYASDTFGKVSLMSHFNDMMKLWAGTMTQDRFIEDAIKLASGKLSKAKATRMAAMGIDKERAIIIAEQFKKYGVPGDKRRLAIANVDEWDDEIAKQNFKSALLKDVDATILTPGVGVKPLWTSTAVGRLIFQFKTFAAEAHHKILVSDLQYRDAVAATNLVLMSAFGVLSYASKQYTRGAEIETDPAKLLVEGLDNSGVLGYFWDVNNTLEKVTRGKVGVSSIIGDSTMSRYASRNAVGALLGPSFGTVSDVASTVGALSSGELTESEIRTMRKLLPYQNLFYTRALLNKIEGEVVDAVAK